MTQLFGLRSRSCREISKKNHFGTGQSVRELHSSSNVDSTYAVKSMRLPRARGFIGPAHPSIRRGLVPASVNTRTDLFENFLRSPLHQRRAPPKTRRIPPEASPAAWPRRPPARGAANRPRPGWRAFSSSRSSWTQDRSRESASKPWVAAARRASSSATTHVREKPACAAWNSLSEL